MSTRLEGVEKRLKDCDVILESVKRIEMAVCGAPALGIAGLVSLHERVASLERERTWRMGVAATLGFLFGAIPVAFMFFTQSNH